MPLIQVHTDMEPLIAESSKVAQIVHDATKAALGKPDMYITVLVSKTERVMIGGTPQGVVITAESVGGDFNALIGAICQGLGEFGVDPARVTGTFRSVSMKEFAMNGRSLG